MYLPLPAQLLLPMLLQLLLHTVLHPLQLVWLPEQARWCLLQGGSPRGLHTAVWLHPSL
jgi:hypothetical protein